MKFLRWFKTFSSLFFVTLAACSSVNSTISNGNEWSLASNKLGMHAAPETVIDKWAQNGINLQQMFDLKLIDHQTNKQAIVDALKNAWKVTDPNTDFNAANLSNNFSSYLKPSALTQYFSNSNKVFPYWLFYDLRATLVDNKIVLKITVIDTTKLVDAANYKLTTILEF